MKTEGPVDYHTQFVVEALDDTIGELRSDVGENVVFVFSDGSCCFHERFEFGARGPGEPAVKLFFGIVAGGFFEDGGEGFFE